MDDGSPDFRFPKAVRLRSSREFQRVASKGRRHGSGCFNLLVGRGEATLTRLGITVSRKVGKAVVRNRIKRVIREYFRLNRSRLIPGLECVVIAKPQAGQTVNEELTRNLRELFVRYQAD
ncbi:MAG: ribonuclease P protein component [Magnetococcales bacterium]|nr:ribonuclease P protein component [Magnetococcales bacterium]